MAMLFHVAHVKRTLAKHNVLIERMHVCAMGHAHVLHMECRISCMHAAVITWIITDFHSGFRWIIHILYRVVLVRQRTCSRVCCLQSCCLS